MNFKRIFDCLNWKKKGIPIFIKIASSLPASVCCKKNNVSKILLVITFCKLKASVILCLFGSRDGKKLFTVY